MVRLCSKLVDILLMGSVVIGVSEQKSKQDGVSKVGKERTTINMMQLQTDSSDPNSYKTLLAADGIEVKDLVQSECLAAFGKD